MYLLSSLKALVQQIVVEDGPGWVRRTHIEALDKAFLREGASKLHGHGILLASRGHMLRGHRLKIGVRVAVTLRSHESRRSGRGSWLKVSFSWPLMRHLRHLALVVRLVSTLRVGWRLFHLCRGLVRLLLLLMP